jgi:hypothetical protein
MMPNSKIASMTKVVMTGRRMKPSAIFMWSPAKLNSNQQSAFSIQR